MKRLTSNNTFEMDPVQLALNQVYIQDGWAWYQGGVPEHDVSVCDLIRTAADTLLVELPMLSDEDLSHLMTNFNQYGEEEPEGVLAILYRALCAQAELRAKLSRYEDTGLEPEEITTEPYGCVFYCNRKCNLDGDWCAEGPGCQQELKAETAKHLLELAQAEKDGRLVVMPYKSGDFVYRIAVRGKYLNHSMGTPYIKTVEIKPENVHKYKDEIGKTVFPAREEAEAALKKRGEERDDAD